MLEIKDLKKSFQQPAGQPLPILDIPAYQLNAGEQAVLIGRSGGGKTTLLHCIAGIAAVTSGKIQIDGHDIAGYSEAKRDHFRAAKLGYVFQTFNLLPGFSAWENVMLGMTFSQQKTNSNWAKELLERVGLSHRIHHKPATMSVGEQQRVAVARALANHPRLLLADEPTANIDPRNQQAIIDLIREQCKQEKITLMLVTHSMEVANQFDRIDRLDEINQIRELQEDTDS